MPYQSALIHLSDLECGANNRAERPDVVDGYRKAADRLVEDVKTEVGKQGVSSANLGLVVTGDIANLGAPDEYERAVGTLEHIRDNLNLSRDLVALIPGNHDVSWPDCRKAFSLEFPDVNLDKEEDTVRQRENVRNSKAKLENFGKLFEHICGRPFSGPENPIAFEAFARLGIALVGLDSTFPCTFRKEDNHGLIRDDQVANAKSELDRLLAGDPNLLPIAAVHHCPIVLADETDEDKSFLLNGTEVMKWLGEAGFSVAMCGHEHKPKAFDDLCRRLQVYVTGTYGLNAEHLKDRYKTALRLVPNKYSILLYSFANESGLVMRQLRNPGAVVSDWIPDIDHPTLIPIWPQRRLRAPNENPNLRDMLHLSPGFPRSLTRDGGGRQFLHVCMEPIGGALRSVRSVTYRVAGKERNSGDPASAFAVDFVLDDVSDERIEAEVVTENGERISLVCPVPRHVAHE